MCVVERRGVLGGAAVTEEFHPGFRNSTASYTVSLLDPKIIRDLRLFEHGLIGALCSSDATALELATTVQLATAKGVPCSVLVICQWDAFMTAWREQLREVLNLT